MLPTREPEVPPAPIDKVPALTTVVPVKVFEPVRVRVPVPDWTRLPVPSITLATVTASLRL